jgi:glucose/arabinose dehydrogenase
MNSHAPRLLLLVALLLTAIASLSAERPIRDHIEGNIFEPAKLDPTAERVRRLRVPPGFQVEKFAEGLEAPRMLATAPNGDVYVTRRHPLNDVLLLRDANGDGKAEAPVKVAAIQDVHGIALHNGKAYLAAIRKLYVADIAADGTLGTPVELYSDLPDAGQHPNRTLALGPDGKLYLSVGSTSNAAPEPNPESATMLVVATDGSGRTVFAKGLRNTIGFDWHPQTGKFWGIDHGIDWLGDEEQYEEINLLAAGKDYGWPFVYERGRPNLTADPEPTTGLTWNEYAARTEFPQGGLEAHSAPMNFLFYKGSQFPAAYHGSAFLTLHGSWNRAEPAGYKVVLVKFNAAGAPVGVQDFLTGFLVKKDRGQFGRPCGLAFLPDGSLLVGDDSGGMIYRVSYTGRTRGDNLPWWKRRHDAWQDPEQSERHDRRK